MNYQALGYYLKQTRFLLDAIDETIFKDPAAAANKQELVVLLKEALAAVQAALAQVQ